MKKLFPLAFLFLALTVQAQDMPRHKKPKSTKDVNVLDITKNQGTTIEYETPAEVQEQFNKRAALNMWTAEKQLEEGAKLPQGGWLVLKIGRLTIGAGNTKYFTLVAQDEAGNEILRKQLENNIPRPDTGGGVTIWYNTGLVWVDAPLKTGTKVFVIDAITNQRHEYLIQN